MYQGESREIKDIAISPFIEKKKTKTSSLSYSYKSAK